MFSQYRLLDSRVLASNGCYSRIRHWIAGHHPFKGPGVVVRYIQGLTGCETEVTMDVIQARNLL
jgi:GMP synthase PP-ATPase subunit